MEDITNIKIQFDMIGFTGPLILMFIVIFYLWNQKSYLTVYLFFYILNVFLNTLLKINIMQDRPSNGRSIVDEHYNGYQKYGMPSTHAQTAAFSIMFLYLVKKSEKLLIIGIFLAILTLYQRYVYNRHTLQQLFIGTCVGVLVAYIGYDITNRYLVTGKSTRVL